MRASGDIPSARMHVSRACLRRCSWRIRTQAEMRFMSFLERECSTGVVHCDLSHRILLVIIRRSTVTVFLLVSGGGFGPNRPLHRLTSQGASRHACSSGTACWMWGVRSTGSRIQMCSLSEQLTELETQGECTWYYPSNF